MLMFFAMSCSADPTAPDSPEALQVAVASAIADGELWRCIDYVQPEDRDVLLYELDVMAEVSLIMADELAKVEFAKINAKFGVLEHDVWPANDPVAHSAEIERVYAGVTDPRGLAEALGALASRTSTKKLTSPVPTLNADKTALLFGDQESRIVVIDGRYYFDEADPATLAAH